MPVSFRRRVKRKRRSKRSAARGPTRRELAAAFARGDDFVGRNPDGSYYLD
jgi:hypothetical protein